LWEFLEKMPVTFFHKPSFVFFGCAANRGAGAKVRIPAAGWGGICAAISTAGAGGVPPE